MNDADVQVGLVKDLIAAVIAVLWERPAKTGRGTVRVPTPNQHHVSSGRD